MGRCRVCGFLFERPYRGDTYDYRDSPRPFTPSPARKMVGVGALPLCSSRLFPQRFSRKVCRVSPRRASDLVKRVNALYPFGACAQICSQQICLGARKSPKNIACIPRAGLRRAQPAHAAHSALALCSIPRSPYATPFQLGLFRQHFNRYAILLRA